MTLNHTIYALMSLMTRRMSVDPSVSLDSGKCFSAGEGFGARLTHLHTRTQYSSVSDSHMRVKLNDEHQVPWRAPQVGRLLVFRGVQNGGSSHATSGAATDGGHWLAAMQESITSQVCPSAAAGATHALRGWQKTATPGLREAWNAQRNGCTAARTTSNDPRLPQETISILKAIAGSPFVAGNLPVAIAVDPTGSYAYVVNQMDATLSAFSIDSSSGALTSVSGSPFATGTSPNSVAIDPSSSFVYVTNGSVNTVSAYAIAAGSGALTAVAGSPFATGTLPDSVSVGPTGSGVYVANESDGTVSLFSIDNGALTANGSPFSASNSPRALTIDPSGQYIYVANATANTISVLNDGLAIPGSPFVAGTQPSSVAVDPTGMFTYVVNSGSDTVFVYSIDATRGALTPIAGSPFVTGKQPSAIAISD
jgi:DNA-binding beta-propeller fold protein YncE